MYGISSDVKVNETLSFDPGIHSNVTLEKVSYENSKNDGTGKDVLAFHFKGEKGETFRYVEWPVDADVDGADKKFASMSKRIKHILLRFLSEDKIIIGNVATFAEYANAIITLLGNANKDKKVAIKLVYDDKDRLGFTKYTGFIADNASSLKIGTSERIVKLSGTAGVTTDATSVTEAF
jgi:hypothetical protein